MNFSKELIFSLVNIFWSKGLILVSIESLVS